MTRALSTLVTADDFRQMPEGYPHYQLIEGELYLSPSPNRYHQVISGNLEFLLRKYLEKHPIGELYDAPFDVYLTEHNVFQPDKAFISKDRLSILTDAGAEGAPGFIVEILSDSTERFDKHSDRIFANVSARDFYARREVRRENIRAIFDRRTTKSGEKSAAETSAKNSVAVFETLKKKVYASAGVIELWFIAPAKKTIEVYFLQKDVNKPVAVHRKTDRFTSPTFPRLTIEAEKIFG